VIQVGVFLQLLFVMKFALDFLSPFRDVNFILVNVVCVLFIFFRRDLLTLLSRKEVQILFCYILCCTIWLVNNWSVLFYFKFLSFSLLYVVVRCSAAVLDSNYLLLITTRLLRVFIGLMLVNFVVSFVLFNPALREFYNFEHANLLGSYILLSLPFIYLLMLNGEMHVLNKFSIVFMAFLSTSTGALLSSLMVLIDFRRLSLSLVLRFFVMAFSLACVAFVTLQLFLPESFTKIFGPLLLIYDGGLGDLKFLADNRIPMRELGEEYQGSFVWRMYAYFVFIDFLSSQSVYSVFFGSGFLGFLEVWDGIAPHNDFLLLLLDFGLLGFLPFVYFFLTILLRVVRYQPLFIPLILVLLIRLLFENNLYSYYVMSGVVMNGVFLWVYSLQSKKVSE